MDKTIFDYLGAIGSISAVVGVVIALPQFFNMVKIIKFKSERLYGKEAKERYEAIRNEPPRRSVEFEPMKYEGGSKITPQLAIERFVYDKDTMQPGWKPDIKLSDWKNVIKTIRFYYKDGDITMVRGWLIKKR